ncbi:class I SAM-dependent methyltransferase [Pelotalea chapellei]|uniref:Class I SAM-dependent methyltransferase n=1 Tax=Pelotalea chapellei TaxID=44671 RepID=A0ABS5UC60_9BACT|nr:class I SAM-dependent methyltransferase [Pelotalea chapellei]MBT1073236.1 class I SAM-dependent methyltransferase [Pelotalea chapellei]
MFVFTASPLPGDAAANLHKIFSPTIDQASFQPDLQRLKSLTAGYVAFCPSPWPAPGLVVTSEISGQSEVWLPLDMIRPVFERLYRKVLRYPPILSSTPFSGASSWASIVAAFPEFIKHCCTPASLLDALLTDDELREKFIFWSFMPRRFYGAGSNRYPGQTVFVREWLQGRTLKTVRCLDAACGDGESSYALASLVLESGVRVDKCSVEGWTMDPLEVWCAAHSCFPHDARRQAGFRAATGQLFSGGGHKCLTFLQADLLNAPVTERFDLIVCNGLLGGPIISDVSQVEMIAQNLTALLQPGGLLLVADHFHAGWKKRLPTAVIAGRFAECGLRVREAGEGLAAEG